jgi:hypothetical protein
VDPEERIQPGDVFSLSWKWVGLASIVTAVGSLGTLVIVAAVKGADALSTVALALAVLAFVIQILIFVAQTWVAIQQNNVSQALNAETRGMLSELRTRSQDTNSILNQQYNKILDRMLAATKETVEEASAGTNFDPVDLQERLLADFRRVISEARESEVTRSVAPRPAPLKFNDPARRVREQKEWPAEKTVSKLAEEGFTQLTAESLRILKLLAEDYVQSLRSGITDGLYMSDSDEQATRPLVAGQFLQEEAAAPLNKSGQPMLRLTLKGRAAARLFNAEGEPPDYVMTKLPNLFGSPETSQLEVAT